MESDKSLQNCSCSASSECSLLESPIGIINQTGDSKFSKELLIKFSGNFHLMQEKMAIDTNGNSSKKASAVELRSRMNSGPNSDKKIRQGRLLLVSLLENFCDLYDQSPLKNRKLFFSICKQLSSMGIIDSQDFIDELSSVRNAYKRAFKELLNDAMTSIKSEKARKALQPTIQPATLTQLSPRPTDFDHFGFHFYSSSYESLISSSPPTSFKSFTNVMGDIYPSRFRDEFFVLEKLGRGGFGTVWKTQNKLDGVEYAIKCVKLKQWKRNNFVKILREVKFQARMFHPNVVRYYASWLDQESANSFVTVNGEASFTGSILTDGSDYSAFTSDQFNMSMSKRDTVGIEKPHVEPDADISLCIQMELCQYTLQQWISSRNLEYSKHKTDDYLLSDQALAIFKQIVEGLDYIHSRKFIHRDIKPSNIYWKMFDDLQTATPSDFLELVNQEMGTWKIGDFGLVADDLTIFEPDDDEQTSVFFEGGYRRTSKVGTALYASPEQLTVVDPNYTFKSDIYSLGILMFELLQPFTTGMERVEALKQVRQGILPDDFVKKFPKEAALVLWLIAENPSERPTAKEILHFELISSLDNSSQEIVPPLFPEGKTLVEPIDMGRTSSSLSAQLVESRKKEMYICSTAQCQCCQHWKKANHELVKRIHELEARLANK